MRPALLRRVSCFWPNPPMRGDRAALILPDHGPANRWRPQLVVTPTVPRPRSGLRFDRQHCCRCHRCRARLWSDKCGIDSPRPKNLPQDAKGLRGDSGLRRRTFRWGRLFTRAGTWRSGRTPCGSNRTAGKDGVAPLETYMNGTRLTPDLRACC